MASLVEHSKTGRAYNFARHVYYLMTILPKLNGRYPRTCNVCDHEGTFYAFGYPPRMDARCPSCGSLERHRLMYLWVQENARLVAQSDVLHFAPEGMMRKLLTQKAKSYRGADLEAGRADLVLDIEDIALPDASVDLVVCNHVLEHVDDGRALAEMRRILRPGGTAILMFPIVEAWSETYENGNVQTIDERILHFGQHDHVRMYGHDVRDRIRRAGFELNEVVAREPEVSRYGLLRGETMFLARKPG